jgi:hypothetical protein
MRLCGSQICLDTVEKREYFFPYLELNPDFPVPMHAVKAQVVVEI